MINTDMTNADNTKNNGNDNNNSHKSKFIVRKPQETKWTHMYHKRDNNIHTNDNNKQTRANTAPIGIRGAHMEHTYLSSSSNRCPH